MDKGLRKNITAWIENSGTGESGQIREIRVKNCKPICLLNRT
jgi:hypothetical protein